MVRQRDLAQIVVDEFGRGSDYSLTDLVARGRLNEVSIYEVGTQGPIKPRLQKLAHYVSSYYWDDVTPGTYRDGARSENLCALTFAAASFDLIVSMEVLEHVFDIQKALTEIARVLKPGGIHVFTIPVRFPMPEATVERARLVRGDIVHLQPERYHVAGDGSKSLVVSDFGSDLIDWHKVAGLRLSAIRRSAPCMPHYQNVSFLARKV